MVVFLYLFCVCTDIIDDIEDLILSFMMELIVGTMEEYATFRYSRQIRSMHKSSLQGMPG